MQCPKCGNENTEPATVCQVCASPLSSGGQAPAWAATGADQPLTTQLYAAAVGPVNTGYYLNHFARFDHRGKAVLTWNWPAFVATLGWMAFRRLWAEALIYLGLCVFVSVVLLGALPLWLGHSESVLGGAAAALVLLLCVLPAVLANGLYYKAINRHVTRALADSPDIATTQGRLRHYASSRPRAMLVATVVALLWLATAGLAAMQWWPQASAPDALPAKAASGVVPPTPLSPTSAPMRSASSAGASVALAASSPASTPLPAAQASTPASVGGASAPAMSASVPASVSASVPASAPALAPSAPVKRLASSPAAPPAAQKPAGPASTPKPRHWVAAGMFAQPENAQRVRQQLQDLGLPVKADQVNSLRGEFTRVRAGPFENRAQARAAQRQMEQSGMKGVLLSH